MIKSLHIFYQITVLIRANLTITLQTIKQLNNSLTFFNIPEHMANRALTRSVPQNDFNPFTSQACPYPYFSYKKIKKAAGNLYSLFDA